MWDMFANSLKLLLKGKLFRNPMDVLKCWAIGFVVALIALVGLTRLGVPLGIAVVVTAFGTGLLQPWLFKDLKYN